MFPWLSRILALAMVVATGSAGAAEITESLPRHESNVSIRNEVQLAIDKGLAQLESTQRPDGSWGSLGTSSFVVMALQRDPRQRFAASLVLQNGYAALQRALSGDLAAVEDPGWNLAPALLALRASGRISDPVKYERARQAVGRAPPKEPEKMALAAAVSGWLREPSIAVPPASPSFQPSRSALAALVWMRLESTKVKPGSAEASQAAARLGEAYTPERNSGSEGVHRYYFWLTTALTALDSAELPLPGGRSVDVARQLSEKLINEQNGNGSWSGVGEHPTEKDSVLVTASCLLALEALYNLL